MSTLSSQNDAEKWDQETRARAIFATKVFCRLCDKHKIKTCSWEKSPVWSEYVEGKIDESELSSRAEANVRAFVKMVWENKVLERPVGNFSDEDHRARRSKIANKIYRGVCTKSGLDKCFFNRFAIWSEYVNGVIDEDVFIEDTVFEVLKMKENGDAEKKL